MRTLVLYQWTHAEVISSTSARVSSGPASDAPKARPQAPRLRYPVPKKTGNNDKTDMLAEEKEIKPELSGSESP